MQLLLRPQHAEESADQFDTVAQAVDPQSKLAVTRGHGLHKTRQYLQGVMKLLVLGYYNNSVRCCKRGTQAT